MKWLTLPTLVAAAVCSAVAVIPFLPAAKNHPDVFIFEARLASSVAGLVKAKGALSVKTCVLLDKKARRAVPFEADYVGFEIPNEFVVGYGLDFNERYRNLPCIGVLKPKFYGG